MFRERGAGRMNELKTLKDLEEDPIVMRHCNHVVSSYDLKQEAIKWVKPCDWSKFWKWCKKTKGFTYEDVWDKKNINPIKFIEAWIEYFFNITEGDLKKEVQE